MQRFYIRLKCNRSEKVKGNYSLQLRLKKLSTLFGLTAKNELKLALPFLLALFALKALISYLIWRNGFLEYDADGFTRSLHAWEWSQQPRFEVDAWLPLQFWLNGALLQIWPDLFREPRAVNLVASLVTTTSFFFIGRSLFGRLAGYGTALLAALFPWEIWFGLSGMSESLTHMFLSVGMLFFCRWLQTERSLNLWLASAGLLGATLLRYEAWFYSITYAVIILCLTYLRHRTNRPFRALQKVIPPLALAFSFTLLWVIASIIQFKSPFGFVSLTSKINASLEERNAHTDLLGRLLFYPQVFFNLLRPLTLLAMSGSLLLWWKPLGKVRVYLALIWGEFALFIVSTLPTNNIAPGSARYPVSNLMFLLPTVVYLFIFLAKKWPQTGWRVGLTLIFLGLALFFIQTAMDRPNDFPDQNMRQVALWFKEQTKQGKLPQNSVIPVHLPNPQATAGADYGVIYGLSVLTNRPDGWRIKGSQAKGLRVISDIEGFEKTIQDDKPLAWLHLDSAEGKAQIDQLAKIYREKISFGPYQIFSRPLQRPLTVTPLEGRLDQHYIFTGEDFDPGEHISLWLSYDSTGAKTLPGISADKEGYVKWDYLPDSQIPGTFSITALGESSQRRAIAEVTIHK